MNKKLLCSLLLSAFVITGCGEDKPAKPDYSNLFNLVSPSEPVCMVNEKVKEYSDGIYAQREAAGVNAKDENKIVSPLYSEATQVADFKGDYDENKPVELSFTLDESIKDEKVKLRYWVEGKDDDYVELEPVDGKVTLQNLFRSTVYEWQVITESGKKSKVATFETGDYVRFLTVGSIPNFRDNGGWTTVDGKKIKQGLVYRGFELNDHDLDKSGNHNQNISGDDDPGKKVFVDDLGIRAEVDLRGASEADNAVRCGMNPTTTTEDDPKFVSYERLQISSYADGLKGSKENIKKIFEEYLANADEKPVYYHCYGGADRTGTIGFLLGAILGMSYSDLIIDYEATTFSNNLKEHNRDSDRYTYFPAMLEEIQSWSYYDANKPLSEIIETYLVQDVGVAQTKINRIREIMLEDAN